MPYSDLLAQRRIRPHGLRPEEIAERLRELWAAFRQARADAGLGAQSLDGRYQDAYAAVRHLAEMVMTAEGYRPASGPGQHEVVFLFLALVPGAPGVGAASYFQRCRRRRNVTAYDQTGTVAETEVTELIRETDCFADQVRGWLAGGRLAWQPQE